MGEKYAAKRNSAKLMEEVERKLVAKKFDAYNEEGVGSIDEDQARETPMVSES